MSQMNDSQSSWFVVSKSATDETTTRWNQEHKLVERSVELHPRFNLMLWTMGSLRLI